MRSDIDNGRVGALDGFRGVAVLLVFAAHLLSGGQPANRPFASWTVGWVPGGGVVGVQLFFVLSGYLITGILVREVEREGGVTLRRFWWRRARRLYPALLGLLYGYIVVVALTGGETLPQARGQILNGVTYTTNFQVFGEWGWLGHLWSLAVEEQFYLAWPLIVAGGWAVGGRRAVCGLAVVGVAATVAARATLGLPPAQVYELLRWDALLIGCLLALVPLPTGRWVQPVGVAGAGVVAWMSFRGVWLDQYLLMACAGAAALVAGLRWSWLENRVLRWFGRVSYSLYLWHVLILRLGWPGWVTLVVSLGVSVVSHRLIEERFRVRHEALAVRRVGPVATVS